MERSQSGCGYCRFSWPFEGGDAKVRKRNDCLQVVLMKKIHRRTFFQAFGNHEFDDGMTGLEPFVRNLSTPIANSNIEDKGSPIRDLYNRKSIKEIGGQKVGK